MKNDYHFSGIQFEFSGSIELGLRVGIEIAKGEIFGQASIGIIFTLGDYIGGGEYAPVVLNNFVVKFALGFRLYILGFSYQQDLISYTIGYDVLFRGLDMKGGLHSLAECDMIKEKAGNRTRQRPKQEDNYGNFV